MIIATAGVASRAGPRTSRIMPALAPAGPDRPARIDGGRVRRCRARPWHGPGISGWLRREEDGPGPDRDRRDREHRATDREPAAQPVSHPPSTDVGTSPGPSGRFARRLRYWTACPIVAPRSPRRGILTSPPELRVGPVSPCMQGPGAGSWSHPLRTAARPKTSRVAWACHRATRPRDELARDRPRIDSPPVLDLNLNPGAYERGAPSLLIISCESKGLGNERLPPASLAPNRPSEDTARE